MVLYQSLIEEKIPRPIKSFVSGSPALIQKWYGDG